MRHGFITEYDMEGNKVFEGKCSNNRKHGKGRLFNTANVKIYEGGF
jgi:hypothetical protein